ncbi:uncharacterized protein LOC135840708 isoform X1 [Planococcus citri]|uniref:uncharacterized protein LOC135837015 isoform X1 n=1 Tax=Planococcus citri TaxID=170843 RepID=UPI0031F8EAF1
MLPLRCFSCQQYCNGIKEWTSHLKYYHGYYLTKNIENGFPCTYDRCNKSFALFKTLRQHIESTHANTTPFTSVPTCSTDADTSDTDQYENSNSTSHERNYVTSEDFLPFNLQDNSEDLNSSLRLYLVKMVVNLQCKSSMTTSSVCFVINHLQKILTDVSVFWKHHLTTFLENNGIEKDSPDVSELLKKFDLNDAFTNLDTLDGQIDAFRENCSYVNPQEIPLGTRIDQRLDRSSNEFLPKTINETFQYVPVVDVLKLVLQSQEIKDAILTEKKSEDGTFRSFRDGKSFDSNPFFQKFPDAIRLQLYYDELEIVNPLASKKGVHKIGAFYYTIQNLPSYINSQLNNIHVLALCYYEDVRKYGFKQILRPFLQELKSLESDEGIVIQLNTDENYVLRASLASFCGDGLAVHDLFGLLSPSANMFCRLCLISRTDLLNGQLEPQEPRTKAIYDEHLALIQSNNTQDVRSQTGVKAESPLNELKYFHVADNMIFDPMHDILCGIGPMVLKLVIRHYVYESHFFQLDDLNERISSFHYGILEMKNKPSANLIESNIRSTKEHALSQRAMQTWCLLRTFPFLIADKIPNPDDEHMHLIVLLLRIMELVFSPMITKNLLAYLDALIIDFISLYRNLFPNVPCINKFHHLTHYPMCIEWSGPLSNMWCMRFEAKHGQVKKRAQVVCNFKNAPKTLIRIGQCTQSAKWGSKNVPLHYIKFEQLCTRPVNSTLSCHKLQDLGFSSDGNVTITNQIKIDGWLFRIGLFVVVNLSNEEELPEFAKIEEIVIRDQSEIYVYAHVWRTMHLDTFFNAYAIVNDHQSNAVFLPIRNLRYKALDTWSAPNHDEQFISLRHILL